MNSHVHKFYKKSRDPQSPAKYFHDVIALHEDKNLAWDKVQEKIRSFPKSWYELSHLSDQDRIEFLREYWLKTLPFVPHVHRSLNDFFNSLDGIGIFLLQWREGLSYECEMVYSLRDDSCFYQGAPPADEREIGFLNDQLGGYLPADFLQFLQVHNGFSKHTDTGIFKAQDMPRIYRRLVQDVQDQNILIKTSDHLIDPRDLIPFYESFGLRSYQCFFKEWYPGSEMGNIYFSLRDRTISSLGDPSVMADTLAFTSFSDWLIFYLETIGG